jgi:hypothetical protein
MGEEGGDRLENSFSRLCGNQILFTEVQKYSFAEIQIGGDRHSG